MQPAITATTRASGTSTDSCTGPVLIPLVSPRIATATPSMMRTTGVLPRRRSTEPIQPELESSDMSNPPDVRVVHDPCRDVASSSAGSLARYVERRSCALTMRRRRRVGEAWAENELLRRAKQTSDLVVL